jgi:RimJ/RimL family protein N-acetyltransferase
MSSSPATFPVGPELEPEQLACAASLPVKPAPVELVGRRVRLLPTDIVRDAAPLFHVSNGEAVQVGERSISAYDAATVIWRYLRYGPFAGADECAAHLTELSTPPDILPMTLFDLASGQAIGSLSFMSNVPAHLKIELGHIWIAPVMQGSGVIYEAVYLMLRHCFDLGYRRLEWKCDALNERSRRTALRAGFQYECTQEYHMIARGRNRDTTWYRILDHEWSDVRARLEAHLGFAA